ncbi:conserved Plasmodium protein, unknown function [Plasmodium malariae]|uniref:Uncharacterized protein n=1 Tax=Plasmodium malariae TaxID=5858 RepID=A0A1A8X2P4_PLAMA|nr:conserved Plasmodium protein, unknown function [Plasmodium malariae]SBS99497.1 conserved Plasmodium protein, unknown function [Plasmodium malariae]SBT81092.1 conserved Plasmodium protein, unknown function [Plasmodium malariae]SCP03693.1 conserved Plasmodium protein, unknown function [Plasmodium malariae]
MLSKTKLTDRKDADLVEKLNYKNINDVSIHELNCLKNNRQVYLKRGSMFFLSTKEEALTVLKNKNHK